MFFRMNSGADPGTLPPGGRNSGLCTDLGQELPAPGCESYTLGLGFWRGSGAAQVAELLAEVQVLSPQSELRAGMRICKVCERYVLDSAELRAGMRILSLGG